GRYRGRHRNALQLIRLVLIRNSPFASLLVHDERPLVLFGKGKDGVAARGDVPAIGGNGSGSHKSCGVVSARAPDLAVWYQLAEYLPSLHARTGVINGNRLAIRKFALRLRGRAGSLAFVLLGGREEAEG